MRRSPLAVAAASEGSMNLYEDELSGAGAGLTQKLVLVSGGSSNPGVQGVARVAEDGSSVYFVAAGVLTEAPNDQGYTAVEGGDNLYVFERDARYPGGHVAFVATLSPGDAGEWARSDARPVQLSADGRYLVFPSGADLTHEGTTPGIPQVYQYDNRTGVLVRASIGQGGYNRDGKSPVAGSAVSSKDPIAYSPSQRDSPTEAAGVLAPADLPKESGRFDPTTEAAVLGFQRARFLAVDGRVGRLTRIVLYAAAGGYPRPTLGAPS